MGLPDITKDTSHFSLLTAPVADFIRKRTWCVRLSGFHLGLQVPGDLSTLAPRGVWPDYIWISASRAPASSIPRSPCLGSQFWSGENRVVTGLVEVRKHHLERFCPLGWICPSCDPPKRARMWAGLKLSCLPWAQPHHLLCQSGQAHQTDAFLGSWGKAHQWI